MVRWTEDENQYLINNYADTDIKELVKHLKKSSTLIYTRAGKLGLSKTRRHRKWSEEDVEFLKNNRFELSKNELATKLNRSENAIMQKLKYLK